MKKLFLLVISMSLLFAGCDLNESVLPDTDKNLKSAELKEVPIKGEMQSSVTEYYDGVPVVGMLSGNISHLGKLIAENSIWHTTLMEFDEQTMAISWEMIGTACAANGDQINYTLTGGFSIPNNEITGHVNFDGGTGRFEYTDGYMSFTGYADDPMVITTMYMQCEGMISNVGSSK